MRTTLPSRRPSSDGGVREMGTKKILIIALLLVVVILLSFVSPNAVHVAQARPLAAYTCHPGFPIIYDEWTERASVTIADINNDGSNELLLATYAGKIHAWSSSGVELPGFPIVTGLRIRGHLALGDLNHDGDLEIAAGLDSTKTGVGARVAIWHPDGKPYPGWPRDTACARSDQNCSVSAIILADLDNDSNLEVIAATTNRDLTSSDPSRYVPNLYVWKNNGQLAPGSWPNEDDHNVAIIGQMAVGDLDGDTYPDIVTGRDYNRLFAFNRWGENLSGWPHYVWYPYDANNWKDDQIEFSRSSPALADLDQDGHLEYIIPGHRRSALSSTYYAMDLLVYTASANRFKGWELPATGTAFNSSNTTRMIEAPAIGDLTGDGRPEIVLSTQDGYVRAYTADKQRLWQYNYAQGKEIQASETVIGDVDGDGWNEVIFGTFWVNLVSKGAVGIHILDHTGKPVPGSPILLDSVGVSNSPALGDVDGDGLIEIAAATYDGRLYVWDAPGQALPERLPWPMARHDLQRTGRYPNREPYVEPDFSQSRKIFDRTAASLGEKITSTITLVNTGGAINDEIQMIDEVPASLCYIPGTLSASVGQTFEGDASTLRWRGSISNSDPITISYDMVVVESDPRVITNTAVFNAGAAGSYQIRASVLVNGVKMYLPLVQ